MKDTRDFQYIDTQADLVAWTQVLKGAEFIAVDTESDSMHRYQEKVCLIQMTALGQDVVIDPLAVDDLGCLAPIFANSKQVKIFHDAGYDLVCLARDFDFKFSGLFDTMLASRLLGNRSFGLANVLNEYFSFKADKTMQRSDWAQRPLTEKQLHYARYDTHYLIELREILQTQLEKQGRLEWAEEEFTRLPDIAANIRDRHDATRSDGFWRLRGVGKMAADVVGRIKALYGLRDVIAQELDRPPFKVFSNQLIIDLATTPPQNLRELGPRPGLRRAGIERFGQDILDALDGAEPFTGDRPKNTSRKKRTGRFLDPRTRKRYEALREMRKSVAAKFNLEPEVMLSNAVLEEFARRPPRTRQDVSQNEGITGWRSEVFVGPIHQCISQEQPAAD